MFQRLRQADKHHDSDLLVKWSGHDIIYHLMLSGHHCGSPEWHSDNICVSWLIGKSFFLITRNMHWKIQSKGSFASQWDLMAAQEHPFWQPWRWRHMVSTLSQEDTQYSSLGGEQWLIGKPLGAKTIQSSILMIDIAYSTWEFWVSFLLKKWSSGVEFFWILWFKGLSLIHFFCTYKITCWLVSF